MQIYARKKVTIGFGSRSQNRGNIFLTIYFVCLFLLLHDKLHWELLSNYHSFKELQERIVSNLWLFKVLLRLDFKIIGKYDQASSISNKSIDLLSQNCHACLRISLAISHFTLSIFRLRPKTFHQLNHLQHFTARKLRPEITFFINLRA